MKNTSETMNKLRILFEEEAQRVKARNRLNARPGAERDELIDDYDRLVVQIRDRIEASLEEFLRYPPWHLRHAEKLNDFFVDSGGTEADCFKKSVFLITKFPRTKIEDQLPDDVALRKVIDTAKSAVKSCGYTPRIADEEHPQYHPQLWDNVELHLLCCSKAIVILEDKYKPELNPNVTCEWGWMRGMGRDVLILKEATFKDEHFRADVAGFLVKPFKWGDPKPGIDDAVSVFLKLGNST